MIEDYINKIICGDCLLEMPKIPNKSIDMILCDLPYGTTVCSWDTIIPFEPLWKEYKRIIKDNGAIVLTASQPFTSALVMSNPDMFKYSWIYKKRCASNFAQAKYAPMKEHEDVLVFSKGKTKYNPIKEERKGSGSERAKYKYSSASRTKMGEFVGKFSKPKRIDFYINNGEKIAFIPNKKTSKPTKVEFYKNDSGNDMLRFPSSVQEFNNRATGDRGKHPTQKPVALFEYLIKTYTNEGDLVLDNCAGSGTTGVACKNLNRNFILIEKEEKYCEISRKRLQEILL